MAHNALAMKNTIIVQAIISIGHRTSPKPTRDFDINDNIGTLAYHGGKDEGGPYHECMVHASKVQEQDAKSKGQRQAAEHNQGLVKHPPNKRGGERLMGPSL